MRRRAVYELDDVDNEHTPVYRCSSCGRWKPWSNGGTDSEDCDECWCALNAPVDSGGGVSQCGV